MTQNILVQVPKAKHTQYFDGLVKTNLLRGSIKTTSFMPGINQVKVCSYGHGCFNGKIEVGQANLILPKN